MLKQRKNKGSALAEFGPALGILLIGFFFPLLNLLGLFTTYGACYVLSSTQINEAAFLSASEATARGGLITYQLPDHWMRHGLGKLAGVVKMPSTSVTVSGSKPNEIVTVATTFECRPWVVVPLPIKVPGLNSTVTFQIESRQPVESATDRR
jgi:hypothetical protein